MDITTNRHYKTFTKISRYQNTPIMFNTLDERYQCDISRYLDKSTAYALHKVEVGDTLDTLALYYYGNPTYYWMIADFNDIFDAFQPLVVGTTIKIPTFASVQLQY